MGRISKNVVQGSGKYNTTSLLRVNLDYPEYVQSSSGEVSLNALTGNTNTIRYKRISHSNVAEAESEFLRISQLGASGFETEIDMDGKMYNWFTIPFGEYKNQLSVGSSDSGTASIYNAILNADDDLLVHVEVGKGFTDRTNIAEIASKTTSATSYTFHSDSTKIMYCVHTDEEFETYEGVLWVTKPAGSGYSMLCEGYLLNTNDLKNYLNAEVEYKVNDDEYGAFSNAEGYGSHSFDNSSDVVNVPQPPQFGASSTGFINVYNPSISQLVHFGSELFPDFDLPTWSDKEGLEAISDNIKNLGSVLRTLLDCYINSNLINYVIDCHVIPFVPETRTNEEGIRVGFKTFDYNANVVTNDYVQVDLGYLSISEYYRNFLDYSGTRAKLYLPLFGFIDLKPEFFQDGKIHIVYNFNVIDCTGMIYVLASSSKSNLSDSIIATCSFNCAVHIPITSANYAQFMTNLVTNVQAIASSSNKLSTTLKALETTKPDFALSNNYSSSSSYMSVRTPYLIIERPVSSFSESYTREKGLPLNVRKRLGVLSGFTKCENFIINFDCLKDEMLEIEQCLREGIIL